jgi:ABC-type transport system substrate-binding protein
VFNVSTWRSTRRPKLADLKVARRSRALNRQAWSTRSCPGRQGRGQLLPDTVEGFNPDVTKYDYNPEKAKALLAEAGASNLTLRFHYPTEVTRPYMPNPKDLFELLSSDLKAVGINVQAIPLKWSPDYLNATSGSRATCTSSAGPVTTAAATTSSAPSSTGRRTSELPTRPSSPSSD